MSKAIPLLLFFLYAHNAVAISTSKLVLSTVDGTTTAFDKTTGSSVFTYHTDGPTIRTWAAPGIQDYVPSLDGLLYRLSRSTSKAHVVHGNYTAVSDPERNDAVLEILRKESVLLAHLRSGRVVPITAGGKATVPSLGKYTIAISQISVSASIVDIATKAVLANASLVHHIPYVTGTKRCVVPQQDTVCAQISDSRDKISVRDLETGKLLWSHDLPSSAVSLYSLGGVRFDGKPCGRADARVSGTDVFVAKEGKSLFAMMTTGDYSSARKSDFKSSRKRRFTKYHIANVADTRALRKVHRPFSFPVVYSLDPPSAEENDIMSALRGLFFLALRHAGQFVGFLLGGNIARKGWSHIEDLFEA